MCWVRLPDGVLKPLISWLDQGLLFVLLTPRGSLGRLKGMEKTAADILERAAQSYEAETVNWCQEVWVDPELTGKWAKAEGWATGSDWKDVPSDAATKINACAMGAMALADGWTWQQNMQFSTEKIIRELGSDQLREAVDALENHLELERPSDYYAIPGWNDEDDRTKDEVIEAMKATAKDLRNRGVAA